MPELPEVENFARVLHERHAGQKIESVVFRRASLRFPFDKKRLAAAGLSKGSVLLGVDRVGKQLRLVFERGQVFISLGMSGSFVSANRVKPLVHEHVTIVFEKESEALGYVDPRRFGFFSVTPPIKAANPLVPRETEMILKQLARNGSRRRLRDVLLDQNLVAGVGNIYMCEACFRAGVDPFSKVSDLVPRVVKKLSAELSQLLEQAIALGGSTISTYRRFGGEKGSFQALHQVYGRAGQPCVSPRCTAMVVKRVCAGRGTYFCPDCQHIEF